MKNILSIMFLFALLASSCSEDELVKNQTSSFDSLKFTASFEENDSRTYVEEGNLLRWTEGDQITLFVCNTLNQQYQFDGETGDNSGYFTKVSNDFGTGNDLDCHYAVYPYASDIKITDGGVITATLPIEQSYAVNSFGLGANTMVAVTQNTEDTFLKFKNVGGYLQLHLYGADVTVKSITLTGNNNEKLAGKAIITSAYGQEPTISMTDDATKSITLDCGENGVKIGATAEEATSFWMVVPPTTFEKGLEVTITDINGGTFTKSTSNEIVIDRNVIKPMAAFGVEIKSIPNNQIRYTYSGEDGIKPYSDQAFLDADGNVLTYTNEYANGKGILKFDGILATLGYNAFYNCEGLTSIIIPENVITIGMGAFGRCSSMKEFKGKFATDDGYSLVANGTLIAFASACDATEYAVPDGVTTIGEYAFWQCKNLTSISIPNSVTTIGTNAFYGCDNMKEVYCEAITPPGLNNSSLFGDSWNGKIYVYKECVDIYKSAWSSYKDCIYENGNYPYNDSTIIYYTTSDEQTIRWNGVPIKSNIYSDGQGKMEIYGSLKLIPEEALQNRSNLTAITIPSSVTKIGDSAFSNCTSLTSIDIPNSVTEIGQCAFHSCKSLTSAILSDNVTAINYETFFGCEALKSITIPDRVTHIAYYAFQYCTALQNVIIGNSVKTIANYAFDWCESLQSVTIPENVTSIGMGAFRNCESLKEVCCLAVDPPTLGNEYVFYNNASGRKFYVQIVSLDAYERAKYWSDYNIIADYTPVECTSLTIEADDVAGYMTSTTIRYSAITNGLSFNRFNVNNITITGETVSDKFNVNTSLTESIERTISLSYLGKTATTTIAQGPSLAKAYTVDLNDEWQNSTAPNPDPTLYDGVYESFSNYHWNRHSAEMYIDIAGYENFTIYIRCDSEASYDYLKVYLDNKFIMDTYDNGSSDTSFSGYTEVKFSNIDTGPHRIRIYYDKDESDHSGADRGYVFIPKNQ